MASDLPILWACTQALSSLPFAALESHPEFLEAQGLHRDLCCELSSQGSGFRQDVDLRPSALALGIS